MPENTQKPAIGHFDEGGTRNAITDIAAIIHEHERRTVTKPEEMGCYIENGISKPWDVEIYKLSDEQQRVKRKKILWPQLTSDEEAVYQQFFEHPDYLKLQGQLLSKDRGYVLFLSDNLVPNFQKGVPPGSSLHDLSHHPEHPLYKDYLHVLAVDILQRVRRKNPKAHLLFLSSADPTVEEQKALNEIGAIAVNKASLEYLMEDKSRSELGRTLAVTHAQRADELPAIGAAYEDVKRYNSTSVQRLMEAEFHYGKRGH